MSGEGHAFPGIRHEQTTPRETAVRADDSLQTNGDQIGWVVVCLKGYWEKGLSFTMKILGNNQNKELKLPQSTFTKMMEQAKNISKDYIYHKLAEKEINNKLSFGGYNSALSENYINAGHVLEKMYPKVYRDVSRKIGRTMSSQSIVKTTLNEVLNILFRDSVTWGKIVSMFAIAGSFAEECVQQGHPSYVNDVVDTIGGFTAMRLVEWLVRRGGWKGIEQAFKEDKDTINPSLLLGLVGALIGFVTITMSFVID